MPARHAFTPNLDEALEDRQMLSHAGITVGTLGDSYTDEYRFYPPDRSVARNWVEILHALRGVSFGSYSVKSRGVPRNQGFAYNWAQSDATSNDMIANQLPGLRSQVASGQVKYAWVFIGGNDFLHFAEAVSEGRISSNNVPDALAAIETNLETNLQTAVTTLLAANPKVKVVVSTLPDISILPIAQVVRTLSPTSQALFSAISQAIQEYNDTIASMAATVPRVGLVDLAATTRQLSRLGGTVSFGGATIQLTGTGDDYRHFFLNDGVHVGTVAQGIIAEQFAQAIDDDFGAKLKPPSPRQIVLAASAIQRQARRGR